jgi:MOSC domain-containing protein YiiM
VIRQGKVVAINISAAKGTRKKNVGHSCLISEFGLKEDAHAGDWHRQVSLLAQESIDKMVKLGLKVGPGDFAENITTQGIDLLALPIGTRFRLGRSSLLEVTQIGKVCHTRCAIFYQAGDCVMPKEGIFARVLEGGEIQVGDEIDVLGGDSDPQR